MIPNMEHLLKIIALHNDNKSALANKIAEIKGDPKVSSSHINNWLYRDKKVPSDWVLPLSQSVNWEIKPNDLRPDIYPHPDDGLPPFMRCKCESDAA